VDSNRPALTEGLPDESLQEINRLWTIVRAFANAAHDLNNALQIIAGSAELVESRELDPAFRRRVESIREQAARAAATIERLALYSRDSPETRGATDLAPLVESAVSMRAFALGRARITVVVERSDPDPYWVAAERNRTLQALLNVLLSAEAAIRLRPHVRIGVRLDRQGPGVCLSVTAAAEGEAEASESVLGTSRSPAIAAVTSGAEAWAAAYLVTAQRGSLHRTTDGSGLTITLTLPSSAHPS
jgi:signal transduction histidine kinase